MLKQILIAGVMVFSFNGCTTLITAPIEIAGAVVGATIDVAAAGGRAITNSGKDDKEEKKD